MSYNIADTYSECFGGDEGYLTRLIDVQVSPSLTPKLLKKYTALFHPDELITYQDSDYSGNYFQSSHESWTDLYLDLLAGSTVSSIERVSDELLQTLLHDKHISNGWIYRRDYFCKKEVYFVSDSKAERLHEDDKESFTATEIIKELIEAGKIQELTTGVYIKK